MGRKRTTNKVMDIMQEARKASESPAGEAPESPATTASQPNPDPDLIIDGYIPAGTLLDQEEEVIPPADAPESQEDRPEKSSGEPETAAEPEAGIPEEPPKESAPETIPPAGEPDPEPTGKPDNQEDREGSEAASAPDPDEQTTTPPAADSTAEATETAEGAGSDDPKDQPEPAGSGPESHLEEASEQPEKGAEADHPKPKQSAGRKSKAAGKAPKPAAKRQRRRPLKPKPDKFSVYVDKVKYPDLKEAAADLAYGIHGITLSELVVILLDREVKKHRKEIEEYREEAGLYEPEEDLAGDSAADPEN